MRLESLEEDVDNPYHEAQFEFDDGGMRGLAAAVVWIGLVYRCSREPPDLLSQPAVKELIQSMLNLPSLRKNQAEDRQMAMIQRIIKQNVDAKKMAVSSYEWAMILRSFQKQSGNESLKAADCIKIYNDTPEVVSHGSASVKELFVQSPVFLKLKATFSLN